MSVIMTMRFDTPGTPPRCQSSWPWGLIHQGLHLDVSQCCLHHSCILWTMHSIHYLTSVCGFDVLAMDDASNVLTQANYSTGMAVALPGDVHSSIWWQECVAVCRINSRVLNTVTPYYVDWGWLPTCNFIYVCILNGSINLASTFPTYPNYKLACIDPRVLSKLGVDRLATLNDLGPSFNMM